MGSAPKRSDAWALLGIARRAGAVQVGVERTRLALRAGDAHLVVSASDAAPGQVRKAEALASARGVPVLQGPDRSELGRILGAEACSAAAVTDERFASELRTRLAETG